jgi:hypothetical protein
MSCSLHVEGVIPPDEKWKKMKQIWELCNASNIKIPTEVDSFFEGTKPDDSGMTVDLTKICVDYDRYYCDGFVLDLEKLKNDYPNVKQVRFVRSC